MTQTTDQSSEPVRYFKRVPSDAGGYVRPWDSRKMFAEISKDKYDVMKSQGERATDHDSFHEG